MASDKTTDDEAVVFGDEFLADEILKRLPVRSAVRCATLSKRFRQLLASPHFWLRHRRLGAPLELPHAARLQRRDFKAFQFHVVGPTFVMEHTVSVDRHSWYASTCNGLVLLSNQGQWTVDGIVFNPATKEEARLSLQFPHPGKEYVYRRFLGFGYGPSSKVYKALIRESEGDSIRLMVVSLNGSDGQEPRTVFSCDDDIDCARSLHTEDGKLYLFMFPTDFWDMMILAFDIDSEAVTRITIPEGQDISSRILHVHGRPCIYTHNGQEDTMLWLLTADHKWEQLYILTKESSRYGDHLKGIWDCGGGLLFAEFEYSGAYMYNLHKPVGEEKEGTGGSKLTAVSSLKIEHKWPTHYYLPNNLWDYQPTLISPPSIFGDAAFPGRACKSVAPKHELDGTFLEMTQKLVIEPMMQMLSVLPPSSS